jgi:hypothetical protein
VIGLALLAAVSIAPPSNVPDPLTAAVMQKIANDWAVSDPARLAAANRLILAMDGDSHRKEHVEQAAKSLLYAPLLACVDDAATSLLDLHIATKYLRKVTGQIRSCQRCCRLLLCNRATPNSMSMPPISPRTKWTR